MNKLIGLFGGSFDPVHIGHLNLAVEIMEARGLDEVWFCPAALNPHKPDPTVASDQHRLKMLSLAIAGEPRFRTTDIEIAHPGPSYTVETLRRLVSLEKEKGTGNTFALILGDDAALRFHEWREPDEIVRLAQVFVGRRTDAPPQQFKGGPLLEAALARGMTPTRIIEISSTEVRDRLRKGLYCRHLVPGKVLDYIISNGLYS